MLNSDEQGIIHQLSEAIAQQVPQWFGKQARLTRLEPISICYPYSYAFVYEISIPGQAAVKIRAKVQDFEVNRDLVGAIQDAELREAARHEFETLKAMEQAIRSQNEPSLGCIQPIAYLPPWNALLMREVEATSFKKILLQPKMRLGFPNTRQRFANAINLAGKWLRLYHQTLGDMRLQPFDTRDLSEHLEIRFRQIAEIQASHGDMQSLEQKFEAALSALKDCPVYYTLTHSDFHLTNLLLSPNGQVIVLDFDPSFRERNPVYYDMSQLLTDIEVQKTLISSLGFLIPQAYLQQLQERFIEGYFTDIPPNRHLINLYSAIGMLRSIYWYKKRALTMSGGKKWLALSAYQFMRPYFSSKAHHYLDQILESA